MAKQGKQPRPRITRHAEVRNTTATHEASHDVVYGQHEQKKTTKNETP